MGRAEQISALVQGRHADPFALLGAHAAGSGWVVRTFQPHADTVELADETGAPVAPMSRIDPEGLWLLRDATIRHFDPDDVTAYGEVRSRWLGEARPASTLLIVSGLARPDLRVEVEVVAASGA